MHNQIKPLFSILTVCYNAVDVLPITIKSVLEQTLDNFEYIIIDGGSTDGTVQLLEEIKDKRVHYLTEKDNGIYDACNKGIELARGKYLNILMAGDIHMPNFLFYNESLLNDKIDFLYGGVIAENKNGVRTINIPKKINLLNDIEGMPFAHPTLIVKTKIARDFKYNTKYKYSADLDFICRLYKSGYKGRNTSQPLSLYTIGGIGNSYLSIKESIQILINARGISFGIFWIALKQYVHTFLIHKI